MTCSGLPSADYLAWGTGQADRNNPSGHAPRYELLPRMDVELSHDALPMIPCGESRKLNGSADLLVR